MKAYQSMKCGSSVLRLALASTFALTASLSSTYLHAATDTSNLSVSASVAASCSISASSVSFGSYDPTGAHASSALNGTGDVDVTCTNGTEATVTLGQGSNPDAGSTDAAPLRRMASGGNVLSYSLYSDSGRTTEWGNTSGTGVDHLGTGSSSTLTVYGKIPAAQSVPAGTYTDTVLATVTF